MGDVRRVPVAGVGVSMLTLSSWEGKALGAAFGLVAVYVFAHFFLPERLPLPEPRVARRPPAQPASIPPFLTARGQLNALLGEGQRLREQIPATPQGQSAVAAALLGALLRQRHFW
jgi:hypothetical protein